MIFRLVLLCSLSWPGASAQQLQTKGTKTFTDPVHGYSVQVPASWKPSLRRSMTGEPSKRISLLTPQKNILIVSVSRLTSPVRSRSQFEVVGRKYVDPVVRTYLKAFNMTALGDQKEDKSDDRTMRLWQGTSGIHTSGAPAMLISQHAIRYRTDVMVNIVYFAGGMGSREEVAAVDRIMNSLLFPTQ